MKTSLIFFLLILGISSYSQVKDKHTIRTSYDQILSESARYQDRKVIKLATFNSFMRELQGSLDYEYERYQDLLDLRNKLMVEVDRLNEVMHSREIELDQHTSRTESIYMTNSTLDKKTHID